MLLTLGIVRATAAIRHGISTRCVIDVLAICCFLRGVISFSDREMSKRNRLTVREQGEKKRLRVTSKQNSKTHGKRERKCEEEKKYFFLFSTAANSVRRAIFHHSLLCALIVHSRCVFFLFFHRTRHCLTQLFISLKNCEK